MKQVVFKGFIFLTFSFIFFITFLILGYKFQYSSKYFKLPEKINYVFIGDSHLEYSIIDSNKLIVNISQASEVYKFSYLKLKNILNHNKQIKYVFVDFCNFQIDKKQDSTLYSDSYLNTRFPHFYSLLNINDFVDLAINKKVTFFDILIKATPKIGKDIFLSNNILQDKKLGRYSKLNRILTDSIIKRDFKEHLKPSHLSTINLKYLFEIINLCADKDVKLILIRTPLHSTWPYLQNEHQFLKFREKYFRSVTFLDFKNFKMSDKEFADLEHLNVDGANVFSKFIFNLIERDFLSKNNVELLIESEIRNFNEKLIKHEK